MADAATSTMTVVLATQSREPLDRATVSQSSNPGRVTDGNDQRI
jgi:hypothetical protein